MTIWLSPGDPRRRTGGYLYNAQIAARCGHRVVPLPGRWPAPDPGDIAQCSALLAALPDGELVILDGLALVGALPGLPALAARSPVVLLIHLPLSAERGTPPAEAARLHALETRAAALSHRIVATSAHAARVVSVLHDCSVTAIPPGCAPMPAASPGPEGRMLCVGSVSPRKGHDTLLAACAQLMDLSWTLRCAGERGPWAETLTPALRQLQGRATLLGSLAEEEIRAEYATADLFVLATWDETYGMALAEAAAAGLPIVSTDVGAVPHTVPTGAGILVPPGDSVALAEALRMVLSSPERRSALATAARAAPRRTWDDAARDWRALELEMAP